MKKFTFSCPIEGCTGVMSVDAASREEALEQLTQKAKEHVATVHPELTKTEEEVRADVDRLMVEEPQEVV